MPEIIGTYLTVGLLVTLFIWISTTWYLALANRREYPASPDETPLLIARTSMMLGTVGMIGYPLVSMAQSFVSMLQAGGAPPSYPDFQTGLALGLTLMAMVMFLIAGVAFFVAEKRRDMPRALTHDRKTHS